MSGSDQRRKLPPEVVAALRSWADLDRFEVPEVPLSAEKGWAAVGVIERDVQPEPWPPRPEKSPERQKKVLDTRVMFGCLEVADLEDLLDRLFSDDLRFVQTGVRRPRRPAGIPSAQRAQTYRGSFRVDDAGNPVPGSFEYAPLIDFARHVEHFLKTSGEIQSAVSNALEAIDIREGQLRNAWDEIVDSGAEGYLAAVRVLAKVRVRDDHTRYCTQWIWPHDEPAGQLPAFFRADLLQAANHETSPLLADFLRGRPGRRSAVAQDLDDRATLEPLLAPGLVPRAAWPTGHVLRLSQQVALTALLCDRADRVTAVNGPPGTGKTTLLRDVYANLVTRRAEVMVTYTNPQSAFGAKQDLASTNDQKWSLYQPNTRLCGFEMLVASSNNAAVENVTKELPDANEVKGEVGARLDYFRAAANAEPAGSVDPTTPGFRPGLLPPGKEAWGFAAAALGSRDRVGAFERVVGRFVGHDAESSSLLRLLGRRPAPGEWAAARKRFQAASQAVERVIAAIGQGVADAAELTRLTNETNGRERARLAGEEEVRTAAMDVTTARAEVTRFDGAAEAAQLRLHHHDEQRPTWWARLLDAKASETWHDARSGIEQAAKNAAADRAAREAVLTAREDIERIAVSKLDQVRAAERAHRDRIAEVRRRLATRADADRTSWVTAEWWARRGDDRCRAATELGSAWVDPGLQRRREELFEAAMHVHEIFARSCSQQFAANLRTWLALQSNEVPRQAAEKATLGAWQSSSCWCRCCRPPSRPWPGCCSAYRSGRWVG